MSFQAPVCHFSNFFKDFLKWPQELNHGKPEFKNSKFVTRPSFQASTSSSSHPLTSASILRTHRPFRVRSYGGAVLPQSTLKDHLAHVAAFLYC